MAVSLLLVRTILYAVFLLWAFLAFVLAEAFMGTTENYNVRGWTASFYYTSSVELLVAALLALLVVAPLHFFFHKREAPSVISALFVEIIVIAVFWLLFLGGAAAFSSQIGDLAGCSTNFCSLAVALEVFSWISWTTLTVLAALLTFVSISESGKGRQGALKEKFFVSGGVVGDSEPKPVAQRGDQNAPPNTA